MGSVCTTPNNNLEIYFLVWYLQTCLVSTLLALVSMTLFCGESSDSGGILKMCSCLWNPWCSLFWNKSLSLHTVTHIEDWACNLCACTTEPSHQHNLIFFPLCTYYKDSSPEVKRIWSRTFVKEHFFPVSSMTGIALATFPLCWGILRRTGV